MLTWRSALCHYRCGICESLPPTYLLMLTMLWFCFNDFLHIPLIVKEDLCKFNLQQTKKNNCSDNYYDHGNLHVNCKSLFSFLFSDMTAYLVCRCVMEGTLQMVDDDL